MSVSGTNQPAAPEEPELNETFLERVDRAVLLSKQRDPYRLEQAHRALEQEAHLSAIHTAPTDLPHRGGVSTVTYDINQGVLP